MASFLSMGKALPTIEEVLDALLDMARRSPRAQAGVDAALRRRGIELPGGIRDSLVQALLNRGAIEGVVPLEDGCVLVTVVQAKPGASG